MDQGLAQAGVCGKAIGRKVNAFKTGRRIGSDEMGSIEVIGPKKSIPRAEAERRGLVRKLGTPLGTPKYKHREVQEMGEVMARLVASEDIRERERLSHRYLDLQFLYTSKAVEEALKGLEKELLKVMKR